MFFEFGYDFEDYVGICMMCVKVLFMCLNGG